MEWLEIAEFWRTFWDGYSDEPDDIPDIENLIFQDKRGAWKAAFFCPNDTRVIACNITHNPWTGERLPERNSTAEHGELPQAEG